MYKAFDFGGIINKLLELRKILCTLNHRYNGRPRIKYLILPVPLTKMCAVDTLNLLQSDSVPTETI